MTGKRNPVHGISVYRRGRKWSYRLELERNPLTGARQFEYVHGYGSDDEAWSAAVKAKASHEAGNRVKPSKLTVGGFFDEWMTSINDSVKPTTFVNYSDYQGAYLKPTIWKKPLQKVDVPTLNALYRHLLANGHCKPDNNSRMYGYWENQRMAGRDLTPMELAAECGGVTIHAARKGVARYRAGRIPIATSPGLAPKTVKNVHRMLHWALSDAVAWRYIEYNPAEHTALPRESRKGTRKRGTTWTPDELGAWLAVAVDDRDAAIWVLAATSGMRRSELAGAECELLDLDGPTLEIADTRVVVDGKTEDSDGKTESGRRTISLDPLTVAYLRRHLTMLDANARRSETATTTRESSSATQTAAPCTPTRSPTDSTSWSTGPGSSASACTTCGTPTPRPHSIPEWTRRSWPTVSGTPTWPTPSPSTPSGRPAATGAPPKPSPE